MDDRLGIWSRFGREAVHDRGALGVQSFHQETDDRTTSKSSNRYPLHWQDKRAAFMMVRTCYTSAANAAAQEAKVNDAYLLQALRLRRADADRIDMDTLPVPPLYPVATEAEIADAERRLGFSLPLFLRRIYAEVGNGGFGPGGGLIGIDSGYPDSEGRRLPEKYDFLRAQGWPEKLLPLWDWGCGSWSCVDAATPEGDIVTMDESGRTLTNFTLTSWLYQWTTRTDLHGEIYELDESTIINPFTRRPMTIKRRARAKGIKQ